MLSDGAGQALPQPPQPQPQPTRPPQPPAAPGLDDCCRSGCSRCVFDLHDEALERYRIARAAWEAQQAKLSRRATR